MAGRDLPLALAAEASKQHFRLLELTPELLEIIKQNTGRPSVLELKSSSTTLTGEAEGEAVLCTDDETFKIRQKNSSNSVYVLEASPVTGSASAVAQCQSTLELSARDSTDAAKYIRFLLPVLTSESVSGPTRVATQRELFDSIPLSERECQLAFEEQAILVHPDTGALVRPSASLKIEAWRGVLDGALAAGVDVAQLTTEESVRRVLDTPEVRDLAVAVAVTRAVLPDQKQGVRRLGVMLLEAEAQHVAIPEQRFLTKWQDVLPESWRTLADLQLLQDDAVFDNGSKSIRCNASKFDLANPATTAAAPSKQRRWHEKFKPVK